MERSPTRSRSGSISYHATSNNSKRREVQVESEGHMHHSGSDTGGPPSSEEMEMSILSESGSDADCSDDEDEATGLTRKRRRRRRHSRNLNLLSSDTITADREAEEKLATATLVKNTVINVLLIGLWYTFSISISVYAKMNGISYNKWMFSAGNKGLDFHFPLFTTALHMLVQFSLASLVLWIFPRFRPQAAADAYNLEQVQTRAETYADEAPLEKKPLMTKTFYLTRITPCGTATALDIGLGNFSLRFISLTFFTMCKSSVLAFVLLFAFLFRLEKPTWRLCVIILLMTAGVIMMVAGETAFNALGFALVMSASFCSGFRWSLTQILLLRNPATSNPFASIFFLTPTMFLALIILALPIEGPAALAAGIANLTAAKGTFLGLMILLFPGCLAFMMVAAEFALLKRTSVVTLSVCGIFKEVLTISAASLTFGDELSPINVSGLIVTIASIAGYNFIKISKMRSDARKEAHEILDDNDDQHIGAGVGKGRTSDDEADMNALGIGRDGSSSARVGLLRDSLTLATHSPANWSSTGAAIPPTKKLKDIE